jgi:hypothetical protein
VPWLSYDGPGCKCEEQVGSIGATDHVVVKLEQGLGADGLRQREEQAKLRSMDQ